MNIKPLEANDPIYISRLMSAYCLLSKQGKQRVRIIFKMIFEDEDRWQNQKEADTGPPFDQAQPVPFDKTLR